MDSEDYRPPFEPQTLPPECGPVTKFCVSPTNGRLEWIQAHIRKSHLNTGVPPSEEMVEFLMKTDVNPRDKVSNIIAQSLGGKGDDVYNIFVEGNSFDRDVWDNEVESMVYYALKDRSDEREAVVTILFRFRNDLVTRAYKVAYQVELPNGDVIENELANV